MATVVVAAVLLIPFSWLIAEADVSNSSWLFWISNYACLPGLLPAWFLLDIFGAREWWMWMSALLTAMGFLVAVTIARRGLVPLLVVAVLLLMLMVGAALASRAAYLADANVVAGIARAARV